MHGVSWLLKIKGHLWISSFPVPAGDFADAEKPAQH